MRKSKNRHIGSSFDEFLKEEGIFEETTELAVKRVLAWQVAQEMKRQHISKVKMAEAMGTSRSLLDKFLDPNNSSVTLTTMTRAAQAIGKQLSISLVDRRSADKRSMELPVSRKHKSSRRKPRAV